VYVKEAFLGCCVEVVELVVVVDTFCALACCRGRMLDILTVIGMESINNKKGSADDKILTIISPDTCFLQIYI